MSKLSNKGYHQIEALSHSLLWNIRNRGVYPAFIESAFNPDKKERIDTDALVQGQLYHILLDNLHILDSIESYKSEMYVAIPVEKGTPKDELLMEISVDDFTTIFIFDFGKSRTNMKYEKIKAYLKDTGKWCDDSIVVNALELSNTEVLIKSLRTMPIYRDITRFDIVSQEDAIEFEYQGMPFKVKADLVIKDGDGERYTIIDNKTTRHTHLEAMQKEGERLGYHFQDFIYRQGVASKFGVPVENVDMIFLMQCKDEDYGGLIVYALDFGYESYSWAKTDVEVIAADFMYRYENSEGGTLHAAFVDTDIKIHRFMHWEPKLNETAI